MSILTSALRVSIVASRAGLGLLAYLHVVEHAWPICLIWLAHIGMDRALGLGLKFASAFSETHLGRVGRVAPTT